MPTGYTSVIENGTVTDLKTFTLRCARAFGALAPLHEEPMDAPIPDEFKPSDYVQQLLMTAKDRLGHLENMSEEEAKQKCNASYEERVKFWEDYVKRNTEVKQRYQSMIEKVEKWKPPSDEHVGLKEFMIEQLNAGIQFDSGYIPSKPVRDVPSVWLANQIILARAELKRAQKSYDDEIKRTADRNRWVKQLKESLIIPHE